MSTRLNQLIDKLAAAFAGNDTISVSVDLVEMHVKSDDLLAVALQLRDDPNFAFAQLTDLCGVDYALYGEAEWSTATESQASFSRAVDSKSIGSLSFGSGMQLPEMSRPRFASVMHLLSLDHNVRLRLVCPCNDDELPVVPSVTSVWACADWYERESFDLYGILYDGHNDLRRILTDYGFIGHPFRKDFPLVGNVEMRFDPVKKRVVYEPVSIEPRVLVPRVIREDNRYAGNDSSNDAPESNNA